MSGVAAKVFWALLGPLFLGGTAVGISMRSSGWFSALDVVYAVVALLVLATRALDQRGGTATIGSGRRATAADIQGFCFLFGLGAGVIWIAAHVVRTFVLKS